MIEPWWLTIGLVLLGAILSIPSTLFVEFIKDKRLSQSTKSVMRREMQLNLITIRDFWNKINPGLIVNGAPKEINFDYDTANRLHEISLQELQRDAFNSLVSILGQTLNEKELEDTFLFYHNLNKLEATRAKFISLSNQDVKGMISQRDALKLAYFQRDAFSLWDNVKPIVEAILVNGNPLGS
jgi:hypothetical protein